MIQKSAKQIRSISTIPLGDNELLTNPVSMIQSRSPQQTRHDV